MLLLLGFWIIAGIAAKDAAMMHYTVKNSSLCLLVAGGSTYHNALWKFNESAIVINGRITPNYRDKVDYSPENHSLCINSLTETDSGIYTFSFFNSNFKEFTENHRLMVEEAVPSPVIRMSVSHSNLSAGFCNVTVNCSIWDEWVFSLCDGDGCSTSQRSLRKVNITIFTDSTSIVCRGNNNVSTSNVSESKEETCLKQNPEQEETSEQLNAIGIVIVVAVFVSLCIFAAFVVKRLRSSQYNPNYEAELSTSRTMLSQPVEAPLQSLPRVSSSTSCQASTCYTNVCAIQPRHSSSPTPSPRGESGSTQSQQVDTVYSFLQVPKGASSVGHGSKGNQVVQEASTSQCVSQDEAQHPKVDTVYSMLQKPKTKSLNHQ